VSKESSSSHDPAVALALSNSMRVELLEKLQSREASASELSRELSQPLSRIGYHLQQLQEAGCIVSRDEPAPADRVDSSYTASPDFPAGAFELTAVPAAARVQTSKAAAADVQPRDGTTRTTETFLFDASGWDSAGRLIESTLSQLRELQEQCEARRNGSGTELIPTVVGLAMCESDSAPKSADVE
jgi:signal transduction histidine kinase